MRLIRKISVGPDYKEAMHFSIGQPAIRKTHTIMSINKVDNNSYDIWITNDSEETYIWKSIEGLPVVIEYNIEY